MRPGRHAAENGSFGRSAGVAAGRAAALLAVAVVLGLVLLNTADDVPEDQVVAARDRPGTTAEKAQGRGSPTTRPAPPPAPLRQPKDVKVLSANGTKVQGAAAKVRDSLRGQGYNVLAPSDANPTDVSAVYFAPTFEREAQALAQALELPPTTVRALPNPPPVPDVRGANVLVVVGPELARRLTSTTTTTRAGATDARSRATSTTAAP